MYQVEAARSLRVVFDMPSHLLAVFVSACVCGGPTHITTRCHTSLCTVLCTDIRCLRFDVFVARWGVSVPCCRQNEIIFVSLQCKYFHNWNNEMYMKVLSMKNLHFILVLGFLQERKMDL